MKRILSLFMVMLLAVMSMTAATVFAADGVSVQVSMNSNLCYGEVATVNCTISNPGAPVGASARLFLNSMPIEGTATPSFMLGSQHQLSLDFVVPATLDPYYQHTILVELVCDNGQIIYEPCMFTVSATPALGNFILLHSPCNQ